MRGYLILSNIIFLVYQHCQQQQVTGLETIPADSGGEEYLPAEELLRNLTLL